MTGIFVVGGRYFEHIKSRNQYSQSAVVYLHCWEWNFWIWKRWCKAILQSRQSM